MEKHRYSIHNKHLYKFFAFDIKEFYPSITENLLKKALTFAEAHIHLSDDDKAIIHHTRKSLTVGYSMSQCEHTMERRFVS